jgi:hypothetical protein
VDRSLRRLGQLLVVMGALLGAALGFGVALMVESAETSKAVAASERERAAVLTASPPSSQPAASPAANSPNPGNGDGSSGSQRAQSVDQRDKKADKQSDGRRNKPGKAEAKDKDTPGKGKEK